MKKRNSCMNEAVVFAIVAVFIVVACAPAIGSTGITSTKMKNVEYDQGSKDIQANIQPVLSPEEHALRQSQAYKPVSIGKGFYWKPPYDNYAPHTPGGMPDFDQKQDQWKAIGPGANGVIDSTPAGDDYHNAVENRIVPGPNCKLETAPAGDDKAYWCFCGAVAVANCFWWFDSKYADPAGTPGDGNDIFALVEDYGAGDDHSAANVPLLIEKLAGYFKTCSKGTTYISDMQDGIDDWFVDTGLDDFFEETTYNKPKFDFIEAEIERSQDVILLLGYYDIEGGEEKDQYQEYCERCEHVGPLYWISWQEFVPTATSLSRVEVKIARTAEEPNNQVPITMTIESPLGNVLTSKTLQWSDVPELPWCTTEWISFNVPDITLIPGQNYYIVLTTTGLAYHWCGVDWDAYPAGHSNFDDPPTYYDWTFRTFCEYGECIRKGGHYLTCAGVNSEEFMIAVSDPYWDVMNPAADPTVHNDPQYVSHDIYDVEIGCPCPDLDYEWWLPDFPADCDYSIVEQAVVICPINNPPAAPTITGPASGNAGTPYTYTFTSTDPDGDQVSYYIMWGDGGTTTWTTFQASGPPGYSESHTWSTQGTYTIKAKAKDTYGAESGWTTLSVTMPKNQQSGQQQSSQSGSRQSSISLFFQILERLQQNIR